MKNNKGFVLACALIIPCNDAFLFRLHIRQYDPFWERSLKTQYPN
jgi:hypothetical protein